jgi:SAM-dependent methyltransferase
MGSQSGFATRGFLGTEPAAVFFSGVQAAPLQLLPAAALYAYHASIEWGLITNRFEALAFNSHWILNDDWYSLPAISLRSAEAGAGIFDALTPAGLTEGRIDRIAFDYKKPDRLLVPVDDALVQRLDHWRDEALRHAADPNEMDEKLQIIFAQLFVLRVVEDRGLAPGLASLKSLCSLHSELDLARLKSLFQEARSRIQSELFDFDLIESIPVFVVSGIISDLYTPRHLPRENLRYNFSWINADILGRAYEKYLSTLLVPAAVNSSQLRLWHQPQRDVDRISVQKSRGVYYTPTFLVQYLTQHCLDRYYDAIEDKTTLPRILDLSCGSGSFLTAAADYLLRHLRARDPGRSWAAELVEGRRIIGIDIDKRAVTLARLSLWLRFAEEPDPLPLPRLTEAIVHGDALATDTWSSLPMAYDVIVGNPPFLATGKIPTREALAARFQTARGRFDYSYLFLEMALTKLGDHGILGMVVPNRLFRNRDASTLRELVSLQTNILTVVDFGVTEVFEGATAYVGTITIEKSASGDDERARIIRVFGLPPRFLSALLIKASEASSAVSSEYLEAYDTTIPRGIHPWMLLSPADRRTRFLLEEISVELSGVAGIYQGIRTGANDIFIVTLVSGGQGPLRQVSNSLGDVAFVEAGALRPVVFGADIQRYDQIPSHRSDSPERFLIYPYLESSVLPESRLKEVFPRAYEYLLRYQSLLAERTSIQASGLRWYELVRRRDEAWLSSKKLITRDLALRTSFAIDPMGETYLVGGTAVVPADTDLLLPMLGFLNSSVANWYIAQTTPTFRMGFQKIEPQHLQGLPVPRQILEPGEVQDKIVALVSQALQARAMDDRELQEKAELEIDEIVVAMTGRRVEEIRGAHL